MAASRLQLAALLTDDVLTDVAKLPTQALIEGAEYFGEELRKAEKLDAEAWQQRFEDLTDEFSSKIEGYAEDVADGDITRAEFRRRMENTIRTYYSRAYQMGASVQEGERAYLKDAERVEVGQQVKEEFAYLRGFVSDIRDEEMSAEAILARADMYADGIRSLYWRGWLSRGDSDVMYDYRSQPGACPECEEAASDGPYELEDCPVPGEVCEGYSRCRCEIEIVSRREKAASADIEKYCAQPARGDGGRFSGCMVGGGSSGGGGGGGGGRAGGGAAHSVAAKPGGGRAGAGSTNFLGHNGKPINGTKAGEIGEHISEHVTRPLIEKHFGGKYVRISHAEVGGHKGSRTTPWDGRVGKHAFDIKTISSHAKSQKAAIKADEIARKIGDARKNGWTSNIIIQRIDHQKGRVDLYLLKGDTKTGYIPSKSWKSKDAIHLGGKTIDVGSYFKVARAA